MDDGPTLLAIVLQTCDILAEEGCKLGIASYTMTLIAHLVIQYVRLHLNLNESEDKKNVMT